KRVRRLRNNLGLRRPVRLKKPWNLGPKPGVSANSCTQLLLSWIAATLAEVTDRTGFHARKLLSPKFRAVLARSPVHARSDLARGVRAGGLFVPGSGRGRVGRVDARGAWTAAWRTGRQAGARRR